MKYILILLMFFIFPHQAIALSEYGSYCADNDDCVKCRDNTRCITCIHNCENKYGSAEGPLVRFGDRKRNPERYKKACNLNLAKWCNAQCWDPDELGTPTTKPKCNIYVKGEKRENSRIFWDKSREKE